MSGQCCKTCKHLHIVPDSLGRRVVRSTLAYPCIYPVELPAMPDSVTRHHWWRPSMIEHRIHMEGSDGVNCPTYERLKG